VFTVKVSSLQQELGQSEFTVYAFSSSRNDLNYVCLSNLIGKKCHMLFLTNKGSEATDGNFCTY
jgi:hypothetical protein